MNPARPINTGAPHGLVLLAGILLVSCRAAPSRTVDLTPATADAEPLTTVTTDLIFDRPFGETGELPTHLELAGPEHLLALTDRATYRLDLEGRVMARAPLPVASAGAVAVISGAAWDGVGLAAAVRWGNDDAFPAGGYLALADAAGSFSPAAMLPLAGPGRSLRLVWDGAAHLVLWTEPRGEALDLELARVPRDGAHQTGVLVSGLPAGSSLGGWVSAWETRAACTVEPGGRVLLRRFGDAVPAATIAVNVSDPDARGSCALATSGRSHLVAYTTRPDAGADAGSVDRGPGALAFGLLLAQLVDPAGTPLPGARPLSQREGTIALETLRWDGHRYLALLHQVGYRGGRLLLAALDETGELLARDLELPLEYEPGRLLAARLALAPDGAAYLCYAIRRPWDEGILRLARLELRGW